MDVDRLVAEILGGRTSEWNSAEWASVLDRLDASRGREARPDDSRLLRAMFIAAQNCGQQERSVAIAIKLGMISLAFDDAMQWFDRAEQAAESRARALQALVLCWRVVKMSGLTTERSAEARHLLDSYDFNGFAGDAELACSLSYAWSEVHSAQVQEGDDQAEQHRREVVRHLREALAQRPQETSLPFPDLRLALSDALLSLARSPVSDADTLIDEADRLLSAVTPTSPWALRDKFTQEAELALLRQDIQASVQSHMEALRIAHEFQHPGMASDTYERLVRRVDPVAPITSLTSAVLQALWVRALEAARLNDIATLHRERIVSDFGRDGSEALKFVDRSNWADDYGASVLAQCFAPASEFPGSQ